MSTTPAEQPLNTPEQKPVSEPVRTYAILQETSGEESESWYTFIKYQHNPCMFSFLIINYIHTYSLLCRLSNKYNMCSIFL